MVAMRRTPDKSGSGSRLRLRTYRQQYQAHRVLTESEFLRDRTIALTRQPEAQHFFFIA